MGQPYPVPGYLGEGAVIGNAPVFDNEHWAAFLWMRKCLSEAMHHKENGIHSGDEATL